uniref:Uncharacterized protein n=1 Tax=Clastoptera arizonana TaxID=38151 RepID=A0A1B6E0Z0_9HEMI
MSLEKKLFTTEKEIDQILGTVDEIVILIEEKKLQKIEAQKDADGLSNVISDLQKEIQNREDKLTILNKLILTKKEELEVCENIIRGIDKGINKLAKCTTQFLKDAKTNAC